MAVTGAILATAVPASALTLEKHFENWVVSGSLTPKKLNQAINLPAGSTFNGNTTLEVAEGKVSGPVTGNIFIPPFKAPVTLAGLKQNIGITFEPVGSIAGSVTPGTGAFNVILSVPTKANIKFTSLSVFGLDLPVSCQTVEPVTLNLSAELNAFELINSGSHFSGTATFPIVRCGGPLGFFEGPLLSGLFSGPENSYSITLAPPA